VKLSWVAPTALPLGAPNPWAIRIHVMSWGLAIAERLGPAICSLHDFLLIEHRCKRGLHVDPRVCRRFGLQPIDVTTMIWASAPTHFPRTPVKHGPSAGHPILVDRRGRHLAVASSGFGPRLRTISAGAMNCPQVIQQPFQRLRLQAPESGQLSSRCAWASSTSALATSSLRIVPVTFAGRTTAVGSVRQPASGTIRAVAYPNGWIKPSQISVPPTCK